MADDIVGGLFGVNPEMYQQQQQQQVFNRAVALQNLNPFQQASVGMQQAGYNLAGALGGALGGVDPQLQRISTLNAISKQIDQSNPESMLQGAKLLADAGFTQEALGLANYARKANSEIAIAQKNMAERRAASTTKEIQNTEYAANLRVVLDELESGPQTADTPRQIALLKARLEGLPQQKTDSIFTNINPSDYTPESIKAFVVSKNYGDLVPKPGKADSLVSPINPSDYTPASLAAFKLSNNYADLVPKAGKTDNLISAVNPNDFTPASIAAFKLSNNYSDLVPISKEGTKSELARLISERAQAKESGASPQILADYDAAIKKQSTFAPPIKIEVPLGKAMEAVLGAGESKEKAAAWGTAGEAYKAAIPMIDKLGQVKSSLSSTFTGAGADAKLAFSKGFAALGVPVDINKISNAEYFNAVSSQLVQAIARVFPGSQSNKELDQLLKSKPNAYQEIPTILRLIGQIQDEMIASTKTYEKLDALGTEGRSKANPSILEGQIYTKLKRYRALEAQAASGKGMKQADIDEAKKLQQELGVQ
jgi:hypothetical protein